jgi:hypothetical protein
MAKPSYIGYNEGPGEDLAKDLIQYVWRKQGQYLRHADGSLHVILDDKRIPINPSRDNLALAGLILAACNVSTRSQVAQVAIQRLQIHAAKNASRVHMRKFSALSEDGRRLYVPLDDGSLLVVTMGRLSTDKNGDNQDGFWVEHPYGKPFGWSEEEVQVGLAYFERLLVDTQACREPAMRWLVAMDEGLFPFVRDLARSRFLLVHTGDSQTGKTTGAERFTLLHGLGSVKGDFSIAAFSNIGDIGLLAMDNKEQNDLSQDYINLLLFLATGAERGRCHKDGRMRTTDPGRPVGVITSIEGVALKAELRKRCVEVLYTGGGELPRGPIEREIAVHRNVMNSALVDVLATFFIIHGESAPNPIPEFAEHFSVLCNLLRAYGLVAGKPDYWAEDTIRQWSDNLSAREIDEDILEHPLLRVLREHPPDDPDFSLFSVAHKGKSGKLHVTDCGTLLTRLQLLDLPGNYIPPTTEALGRRLRSIDFRAFQVLDEERAPDLPMLKRTSTCRPIGFFFENDGDGSLT